MLTWLTMLTVALAAPVGTLGVQGMVTDAGGTPMSGTHTLTVRLFSDAAGTALLHDEVHTVQLDQGRFSTILGVSETLDLGALGASPPYVSVEVDAAGASPVVRMGWVTHAARAHHAVQADTATNATNAATAANAERLGGDLPSVYTRDDESVAWTRVTGAPTVGTGLTLTGGQYVVDGTYVQAQARSAAFDTEAELTAALDDNYRASTWVPTWAQVTGIPADIANGDQDTTYTAGTGITLSGTTFSLSSTASAAFRSAVSDVLDDFDNGALVIGTPGNALPTNFTAGFHSSDNFTIRAGHGPNGTESSTLFFMLQDNVNDSVYIGSPGLTCCSVSPWRGFRVEASGNAFLSGTLASSQGQLYSDLAENVPTAPGVEAGDVVAVDRAAGAYLQSALVRASRARDPQVVGVITDSAAISMATAVGRQPLALSGLVNVKVDARYGAIRPGDLLVASKTPGHAMRARGRVQPGTVVGKALEPLERGTGRVLMLVMNH